MTTGDTGVDTPAIAGHLPTWPGTGELAARRALTNPHPVASTPDVFSQVVSVGETDPGRVAVYSSGHTVSYQELTQRVHRWRTGLAEMCGPGDRVAVVGPRGSATIALFLAIEAIGAVYLPVDPSWPVSRLTDVFSQASPRCVVVHGTDPNTAAGVVQAAARVGMPVIRRPGDEGDVTTEAVQRAVRGSEPRYVMHTSGSTGRPKGAVVAQGGLMNHLWSMVEVLRLRPSDTVAFCAAPTYVISIWQMLAVLLVGGRVAVVEDGDIRFARRLVTALSRARVTVLELVPTAIAWVVEEFRLTSPTTRLPDLRCLLSTGERLRPALAGDVVRTFSSVEFFNAYGASECSDDVSLHRITEQDASSATVPAGTPLPNVTLYLLVEEGGRWRAAESGEPGELWVGGAGVGLGYLNGASAEEPRFFVDEFDPDSTTGRIYRTGDLAVFVEGVTHCLGRADRQIKIAGMRIELDDVETTLGRLACVSSCAVVAVGSHIVGWVVVDRHVTDRELLAATRELLPGAMVPRRLVRVDTLPLNVSGKIDYQRLEAMAVQDESSNVTELDHSPAGEQGGS